MNLMQPTCGRELINFRSFDSHIEDAINEKAMFAHRTIEQGDIPILVDALREWLIRAAGIFTVVGYYRSADLSLWYSSDALKEEFDELLLKFRPYLEIEKGIDLSADYSLLRYRDNLNFIMFAGKPIGEVNDGFDLPEISGFLSEDDEIQYQYALEEAEHFIEEMTSRMTDKFDEIHDARAFVKDLIGDRLPEVLKRHLNR